MASINGPLTNDILAGCKGREDMFDIVVIRDELPAGFEVLRHAAADEAFDMLRVLKEEWDSGANRFDKPGEALVAAMDGAILAGLGSIRYDPHVPGALRMSRFYVYPPYRRRGVGRAIAEFLLQRPEVEGKTVTLNAPHAEAARFWEALGFVRDPKDGHTHIRAGAYAHA
jgi:GNAT superfamily N-acetyltransferase